METPNNTAEGKVALPALVRRLRDLADDEQLDHQDRVTVSMASDAIENLQCKLEEITDSVWCDVHGCIHDRTIDPYDMGYGDPENCPHEDSTPECHPENWRKLWIGGEDKREYLMPNGSVEASPTKDDE